MKGILTSCLDETKKEVELEYEIKKDENNRRIFSILNGVTSYESFYIDDGNTKFNVLEKMIKVGWNACVGTKNSWDDLYIPPEEMKKVFEKEGLIDLT